MTRFMHACVASVATLAFQPFCYGGIIYNEAIDGDLPSIFSAPKSLGILPGSNQVFGATGPTAGTNDRDYFSITIAVGQHLMSINVLDGTTGDNIGLQRALIAITSGPMIDPVGATAAGLLGYYAFGPLDIGTDILDNLAISNTNPQGFGSAQGFTAPLGAGTYTFWVQETTSPIDYRLEFNVVPEPTSIALIGLGLGALLLRRSRRVAMR